MTGKKRGRRSDSYESGMSQDYGVSQINDLLKEAKLAEHKQKTQKIAHEGADENAEKKSNNKPKSP